MSYTVIHGNKRAVFKLKNRIEKFEDIKPSIANYFGLPPELIFLQNNKGEILLKGQKVLDELFPLNSSKIKGDVPTIHVKFQRNMTTLEYIQGDPLEKAAKAK